MAAKRKTKIEAAKAWVSISYDDPPSIWEVSWYREHLRQDLRHRRVRVISEADYKKLLAAAGMGK